MNINVRNPRIGAIGCGYWGKNLVRNLHQLESLSLVCDAPKQVVAWRRKSHQVYHVVNDATDVMNTDIDGIAIATPAETHFSLATQALLAGKDVFVEKPLTSGWRMRP